MKKVFFSSAIVALLLTGCESEKEQPQQSVIVIDFENTLALNYLAGPTAQGENLYEDSPWMNPTEEPFAGAYEDPSGLVFTINESDEVRNFSNGGVAISQWNDMLTESSPNQCSVYFSDAATKFGGYGGSKTFAVVTGGFMGLLPTVSFYDGATECTFDHFWVTNSTYAALSMENGDFAAKKFSYDDQDWFKVVVTAENKNGNPTGATVEFYLADFRTPTSPGIMTTWTKVDLTRLGNNVHAVKFDLQSSDVGEWGMNTPAYFCFDNLAIKK